MISKELHILLIEDDINDAELLERRLKRDGLSFRIQRVTDAGQMKEALSIHSFDLIIADYLLPTFNGLEALRLFQTYKLDIPFITLTGTGAEDIALEMMKEGSDDYVLKDHLERLSHSIFAMLNKFELARVQKRSGDALQESEKAYKLLADNSKDIISRHLISGEFIFASRAIYEITGYTPEEVIGKRLREFLHPDDISPLSEQVQSVVLSSDKRSSEYRFIKKDGNIIWIETSARIVIDDTSGQAVEIVAVTRDITERRKIKEDLEISEARYRIIAETASDVIMSVDQEGVILFVNPAIEKIFGYQPQELLSKNIHVLIPDFLKESHAKGMKDYMQTGIKKLNWMSVETYGLHKKGRIFNIEISFGESTVNENRIFTAIIRDIEDRKKVHNLLIESSNRLSLIFNTTTDIMFLLGIDNPEEFSFVSVNKSFRDNSDLREKDIIGKRIEDVLAPESVPFTKAKVIEAIAAGKPIRFEETLFLKGTLSSIETTYTPIYNNDGKCTHLLGSSTDITKEKKAMSLLAQSENRYRLLAENATDMITKHDLDGYYYYVSTASYSLLGYAPEDMIGKSAYDYLHPEDLPKIRTGVNEFVKKGLGVYTGSYRYKRKDGTYIWIESTNKLIYKDDSGEIEGVIAVSRDITERKRFEDKLEEKIRELDTFIYRSSHDLKGPLASLLGLVNIAKTELKEDLSLEYIGMIERSVKHLDSILMDLLNITRITQGNVKNTKIEFKELVRNTLNSFQNLPDFDDIQIDVDIRQVSEVYYDRTLLNNILHNLIINAIKYQDTGKTNHFVKISIMEQKDKIELIVEDNGEGIPESMQKSVFDMFFRGNTKSSGTGLGLYIVKNAVDKLAGSIDIVSKEKVGTKFIVTLPLSINQI